MGASKHYSGRAEMLARRLAEAPDPRAALNNAYFTMKSIFDATRPGDADEMAEPHGEVVFLPGLPSEIDDCDEDPSDADLAAFEEELEQGGGVVGLTAGAAALLGEMELLLDGEVDTQLFSHAGQTLVALREHLDRNKASTSELDELEATLNDPIHPAKPR